MLENLKRFCLPIYCLFCSSTTNSIFQFQLNMDNFKLLCYSPWGHKELDTILTVWITTNWKILQEVGIPDHLTCLLRNLYAGKKQQLELDMEQQTGSKLGKEYVKVVYCHPAYWTYIWSTSRQMPGWMKHKLESRLLGEITTTSDMQMTLPLWQKAKKN